MLVATTAGFVFGGVKAYALVNRNDKIIGMAASVLDHAGGSARFAVTEDVFEVEVKP